MAAAERTASGRQEGGPPRMGGPDGRLSYEDGPVWVQQEVLGRVGTLVLQGDLPLRGWWKGV